MNPDAARPDSPAAERNRAPILAELQRLLPPTGRALEVASGSGQHALHFASALPGWQWQPTDADPGARATIVARVASSGVAGLLPPLALDVASTPWPLAGRYDALFCANLLQVAPWPVCAALMAGAAHQLTPGGLLLLYGPFLVDDEPTAASNLAFDADLRARDPAWGLRPLARVVEAARSVGLVLRERVAMPANNLLLVFGRDAG